ncbi:hypothetical protein C5167_006947 [Papaver somniferum]|uniref:phenylalanine--tRNA ligase n=1 Tax=Papaver somniferum TaxID=3469 RepID=A0A4Y7JI84_PAPSO|nr:phenylalanine--tRNA ligase alpha subunit, cytoplasmic-like [Papaver somniferum]RZC59651.1 hypothetical protein C5167_006947 [Papaver somniferum]
MAEKVILEYLNSNGKIEDSGVFSASVGLDHKEIVNTIRSLSGFQLVAAEDIKKENWVLSKEGESYCELGSPEFQVFLAVPPGPEGISLLELKKKCGPELFKIGSSAAIKNKWIQIGKEKVLRKAEDVSDQLKELLLKIKDGLDVEQTDITNLKRRKLIELKTWIGYSVSKGAQFALERKKLVTDLTRGHLQSGDWENLEFKEYNVNAKVTLDGGHLHPLLKVREQFRNIFIEMGFEEMPTNNYVESSFWNFDSLFQPQQHPARDSHDTFFLNEPSATQSLPEDYVEKVKSIHESGGYGSKGYGYDWKREEANKNVLRTHTTAVSARMLYQLAQGPFTPKRYFSIDRVFRNEAVDRTHLAEFHQIEGVVCDRGLTLGDLMGVLRDFFERLGMKNLRFKPTYNPYTEPSMEIYSYHEGFKKWVEVGNSGMFRPEMLRPMGLPEDVTCIAWGLSLERPTMILYGIDNIRDLFGPKVDIALIKRNPICRLGINY